jgi:hypothetical protein
VHPGGAAGEQHDPEVRVEEVEQRLDLLDHVVLAAGIEETAPVGKGFLQVVLAAGGVGQDAVDVDDDRRPRLHGAGPPGPVLSHR